MDKPDQIRWNASRRAKYALLIKASKPWLRAGVKSQQGKSIVRWNNLQTGDNSAPILAIKKVLHATKKLLSLLSKS